MTSALDALRERLTAISEELAELAIDNLRNQLRGKDIGFDERRITRARRSIDKAVALLSSELPDEDLA